MRALNAVRRVLLLLVLVPVVVICLDALLRMLGARPANPIVAGVRDLADVFILDAFTTVFRNQTPYQDAAVALAAYGVLALLIVFVFRGLQAMVGSRPPRPAPPAAKPTPKPAATAPSAPTTPPPSADTGPTTADATADTTTAADTKTAADAKTSDGTSQPTSST